MMETTITAGSKLEQLQKFFGTALLVVLFMSMMASFVVSLSQNIVPLHVVTCPDSYRDIITISEEEYDVPEEYRIMILKHVIFDFEREIPIDRGFEVINDPLVNLSKEQTQDIFYPPQNTAV